MVRLTSSLRKSSSICTQVTRPCMLRRRATEKTSHAFLSRSEQTLALENRRGAEPLHYTADGGAELPNWNPEAQAATIICLIEAGADPNALDNSGVAPLHRAVRQRCSSAVDALLGNGAQVGLKNRSGSTPLHLAVQNTGRVAQDHQSQRPAKGRLFRSYSTAGRRRAIGMREAGPSGNQHKGIGYASCYELSVMRRIGRKPLAAGIEQQAGRSIFQPTTNPQMMMTRSLAGILAVPTLL